MFAYCNNNPVNFVDPSGHLARFHYLMDYEGASACKIKEILYALDRELTRGLQELRNYIGNEDEKTVLEAKHFAFYKGALVIITPFDASFSYGFIGLSDSQRTSRVLNHEYGHILQSQKMGAQAFTVDVAIPSITANVLDRMGKLPYSYYGSWWEAEADNLGGVIRYTDNTPWPDNAYNSYWDLVKLLWK